MRFVKVTAFQEFIFQYLTQLKFPVSDVVYFNSYFVQNMFSQGNRLKKFFLMLHFFWCSENSQWSKTSVNEKEGKMWLYIHFTLCFDCSFVTGLLIYPQRIRGDVQEPAVLLVTVIIQDSPDISEEEHTLSPFRLSEILLAS